MHRVLIIYLLAATAIVQADDELRILEQTLMQQAVEQITPSMVQIDTVGGHERVGKLLVGTGPTTGLIVDPNGYIVSSAFNFIQQPSSILVTLPDGHRYPASIQARDYSRMLVLLKVDVPDPLSVPTAVSRDEMQVGQWAIAVGKTFPGPPTRSVGILSAKNRIWSKAIQTDAKVSPNNYGGPLIDLEGQVLGILVPLSPQGRSEIAGNEWYDSGIGFAIPLTDVMDVLERWKTGEDLHPGIMGISLIGKDIFMSAAKIAACLPNSPATRAGLQSEDVIVKIDNQPIKRQVQLKHALGRKYAGEDVSVVALRNGSLIETSVTLTDTIEPYQHPFLGILPRRDRHDQLVVRHVFDDSPAQQAGIQLEDVLVQIGNRTVRSAPDCWEAFAAWGSKLEVPLTLERQGDRLEILATLDTLPNDLIDTPPPSVPTDSPIEDRPQVGVIEITVPEFSNKCIAYVPQNYAPTRRYGVVTWLQNPGKSLQQDVLVDHWKEYCHQHDLILLAPQPADNERWHPMEMNMVRKVIDQLTVRYQVDDARVAVIGEEVGGTMAWLFAFSTLDRVRGVAVTDAPLPSRVRPPATDPLRRFSICMNLSASSKVKQRVMSNVDQLKRLQYPVTLQQLEKSADKPANDNTRNLIRWINLLDRI